MAIWWGWVSVCVGLLLSAAGMTWAERVVEGFEGGEVVLPCTVSIQEDLRWRVHCCVILLFRLANGSALPPENTHWKDVISLVGSSNNLRISSLSRQRDDNRTFWCEGFGDGRRQNTTVRVLAKITGAIIEDSNGGQVTVTQGISKSLTCAVTGNPIPPPSYSWRVDNGVVSGQRSNYILTADRSMRSVRCTATNIYSNGSVLSTEEATAALNVLYLDAPSATSTAPEAEDEVITLSCSVQGNPPPTFEWRRSGNAEVMSTSADYRIENTQRSAAGEYTCHVTNSVGSRQTIVRLIVRDISTQCSAASTGSIVGGVIGGLAAGVIVTVLVMMFWTRSRTKDSPEGADSRQISPAGELSGEMRTLPRVADTSLGPHGNTHHNYESLAHDNPRTPGSSDQHYELLTAPASGRENTYEKAEGCQSGTRAGLRDDLENYENV